MVAVVKLPPQKVLNFMKKFLVVFLGTIIWIPILVSAQGLRDAGSKLGDANVGLSSNLEGSVNNVVNAVLYITGTVFMLLLIYGAFVWLKSSGRESEVDRAKKIIITSVIGTAVIMASYAITNFVLNNAVK